MPAANFGAMGKLVDDATFMAVCEVRGSDDPCRSEIHTVGAAAAWREIIGHSIARIGRLCRGAR